MKNPRRESWLLPLMLFASSPVMADAHLPNFDRGVIDSSAYHAPLTMGKPFYLANSTDPRGAALVQMAAADAGVYIGGGFAATGDSVWGLDARHAGATIPVWNSTSKWSWVQNGTSAGSSYPPEVVAVTKVILDSTYTPNAVRSRFAAFRDSAEHIRWLKTHPDMMLLQYKAAFSRKVVLYDVNRGKILKTWVWTTTAQLGSGSDGDRFWSFVTSNGPAVADTGVVLDIFVGTGGNDTSGTGTSGSGRFTATALPAQSVTTAAIGWSKMSASGSYFVLNYAGTPEHHWVFHRGAGGSLDTSSVAIGIHTMDATGLRMGTATTAGWAASMSGADINTIGGLDVLVGSVSSEAGSNFCATQTKNDSGTVIAVYLDGGRHQHVSAGQVWHSSPPEGIVSSTSGQAFQLRGWHVITYGITNGSDGGVDGKVFENQVVLLKLDGSRQILRYVDTHTNATGNCSPAPLGCTRMAADACPSPYATRIMFASNWRRSCSTCGTSYEVKPYVADIRPGEKTLWLRTNGSDSNTGWTSTYPLRNISAANARADAAHGSNVKIDVGPGSYNHFPNPTLIAAGGKRYSYVGDLSNPSATTIPGGALNASYTTVKGFKVTGDLVVNSASSLTYATRDSVQSMLVTGDCEFTGSSDCVFDRIQAPTSTYFGMGTPSGLKKRTVRDTLQYSVINISIPSTPPKGPNGFETGKNDAADVDVWTLDSSLVQFNAVSIKTPSLGSGDLDRGLRKHYETANTVFRYNRWTETNNCASDVTGENFMVYTFRDHSHHNLMNADTIIAHGPGKHFGYIANDGSHVKTSGYNSVDSCYYSFRNGVPVYAQDGCDHCSVTRSVLVSSNDNAFWVNGATGQVGMNGGVLDHNTLVSGAGNGGYGVVDFHESDFVQDTTKFTNNIVASLLPEQHPISRSAAIAGLMIKSTASPTHYTKLVSTWNLYSVYPYQVHFGDASMVVQTNWGVRPEVPDGLNWREDYAPALRINGDSLSLYGGAQFDRGGPDSVFRVALSGVDSLFNANIGVDSWARGRGKDGTDIGAMTYNSVPVLDQFQDYLVFTGTDIGASDTMDVVISNIGTASLVVSAPTVTGLPPISASWSGSTTIAAGGFLNLRAIFTPADDVSRNGTITFTTNDPLFPTATVAVYCRSQPRSGSGGIGVAEP